MRQETLSVKAILESGGFKQGLDEITQGLKDNRLEYNNAAAKAKAYGSSTDELSAKADFLTRNIDEQKNKLVILKRALEESKQVHGENSVVTKKLSDEVLKADTQFAKYEGQLKETKTALDKTATAEDKAGDKAKQMGKDVKGAGDKTKGFKGKIKDFASSSVGQMATLAGGFALAKKALQALWSVISEGAKWADTMNTLSAQTGLATDKLQELEYASKLIDVDTKTNTDSLKKLTRSMYDANTGTAEQKEIFAELGVEYEDVNGELRDNKEVFNELIDVLGSMTNETKRDAVAMELMGKSAQELNPLIKAGGGALDEYAQEAEEMGVIIDEGAVAQLQILQDELDRTTAVTEAEGKKMAASMAHTTTFLAKAWQGVVKAISPYNTTIKTLMRTMKMTKEEAEEFYDTAMMVDAAMQTWGIDADEVKIKQEELAQVLIASGVPATEAQTQALSLLTQSTDAQTYATDQMAEAQSEYDEAINTALDEYEAKAEEYTSAVESTTEKYLAQMGGLFDDFTTNAETSKKDLMGILQGQVAGMAGFGDEVDSLADRVGKSGKKLVDDELIAELKQMSPKALPQIEALNTMTDTELEKYVGLWQEKNQLAREAAIEELEPMAQEVSTKLEAVKTAIEAEKQGMEDAGALLGQAIADGIIDEIPIITSAAQQAAVAAVNAVKRAASQTGGSTGNNTPDYTSGPVMYGSGGVVDTPHMAVVGDTREVIVPLDNRSRSKKLLEFANKEMGTQSAGVTYQPTINISVVGDANPNKIANEVERVSRLLAMEFRG